MRARDEVADYGVTQENSAMREADSLPEFLQTIEDDVLLYRTNSITRVFDSDQLGVWDSIFTDLTLNGFESRALRGLLEELRLLLLSRDAIDLLRDQMPRSESGRNVPTLPQRTLLYALTKTFFDNFYSATSHLASVVVRFSSVFGSATVNENARTLVWARENCEHLGHDGYAELERARLFRAILSHAQQFPTIQWDTVTRTANTNPHIMVFGPESRSGTIPRGATRNDLFEGELRDWIMYAPDEVSVTNSLSNAAFDCVFRIVLRRYPGMGFRTILAREAIAHSLFAGRANVESHQHTAPASIQTRPSSNGMASAFARQDSTGGRQL